MVCGALSLVCFGISWVLFGCLLIWCQRLPVPGPGFDGNGYVASQVVDWHSIGILVLLQVQFDVFGLG